MRRDVIKNVKIVEPPLEELSRKYSAFSAVKRACLGGCGCVIILFIGSFILLKFVLGTGPQVIKNVPDNFPKEIPIYDKDSIDTITYVSGAYKNRAIEIAALVPKIILSPLLLALDKGNMNANGTNSRAYSVTELWKIINTPISDQRDIVQIIWRNLGAEPVFVASYYQTELKKNNYSIDAQSDSGQIHQFSFSLNQISGSFYAEGNSDSKTGTAKAVLTVNYFASSTP